MHKMTDPFEGSGRRRSDSRNLYRGSPSETVPSVEELGRRFHALRVQENISISEVARVVGKSRSSISRFETEGKVSADLLLTLVRMMSSATDFIHVFKTPKFTSIQQVAAHGRRKRS